MTQNVAFGRWGKRITVWASAFVVATAAFLTGANLDAEETTGDASQNKSEANVGNSGSVFHFDSSTR